MGSTFATHVAGNAEVHQHQLSAFESNKKHMGKWRVWMGGLVSGWVRGCVGACVDGWAGGWVDE